MACARLLTGRPLWFIQELFGLTKPIMLAGMNVAAGPELAAAVSNEGGLGVIGGVGVSPFATCRRL